MSLGTLVSEIIIAVFLIAFIVGLLSAMKSVMRESRRHHSSMPLNLIRRTELRPKITTRK